MPGKRCYADRINYFDEKRGAYAARTGGGPCCSKVCYQSVRRDEICNHLIDLDMYYGAMGARGVEAYCRVLYFVSLTETAATRRRRRAVVGSSTTAFTGVASSDGIGVGQGGGKVGNHSFKVAALTTTVCRQFFLDLFDICNNTLSAWIAPGTGRLATPPLHASIGLLAHNAKTLAANRMVRFVLSFAEDFGQPWPVYQEGSASDIVQYLPPCISARELWRLYNKSVENANEDLELAWSTFEGLFNTRAELISVKTQKYDHNCCSRCLALKLSLDRARLESGHYRNVSSELEAHLGLVNRMRQEKEADVARSVEEPSAFSVIEVDFKSSLKIPHAARETSDQFQPFSLHGMDVNVMGVYDHGRKGAHIALFLEGSPTDSNFTIGGVEAYFLRAGNARQVVAYFDSCSGQNRNQNMVRYLAARVAQGFHESVTMRFFPVGHTHGTVDGVFGWLDRAFKLGDAYTIDELIGVAASSTRAVGASRVNAQLLQWSSVANHWLLEDKFERVELRLRKDPIREIRLKKSGSGGVTASMLMLHGDIRDLPVDFVRADIVLPLYATIPRVAAPMISPQRRQALAASIIPLIPKDESYEVRVAFWRGTAACIASSVVAAASSAVPTPLARVELTEPVASRNPVRSHVSDIMIKVIAEGKANRIKYFSDAEADPIAWPVTDDWSEFIRLLGLSKKKLLVRFKESKEGDWLGWAVGKVVDIRTVERLKVVIGDRVESIDGHKFDAEFADGRQSGFVFETEYRDMRVLKEEEQEEGELQQPTAEVSSEPPRKKRGRPRKVVEGNK